MLQATLLLENSFSNLYSQNASDFYQSLKEVSNTTISLQYDFDTFLSFKVYEASQGSIVPTQFNDIALKCQIRGTTYLFNREHLDQMSNRERRELLNHLGIDTDDVGVN